MQHMKRFLSLALVLVMALSCLPTVAFAAESDAPVVAENTTTNQTYTSVASALLECADGETVILLQDASETIVSVLEQTILDLNGYALAADYVSCFGDIIDGSEANTGLLTVPASRFLIQDDNAQLPVKDGNGYRFVEVLKIDTAMVNEYKFAFQPRFEAGMLELLKQGNAVTGITIQVEVSWKQGNGYRTQNFVYDDNHLTDYLGSYNASTDKYGKMFTLTLNNAEGFEELSFVAVAASEASVVFTSAEKEPEGNVTTDSNNQVVNDVTIGNEAASAVVSSGTQLESGTKNVTLTATPMVETTSDVLLGEGEQLTSMDVHVEGVSADNTVPVIVTLTELAPEFLNQGNLQLYHVENGETVEMTRVYSLEEVDQHNEYYYDIATGTVTMALATFSEIAVVANETNPWNGKIDDSWYNETATSFEIFNADQLAGLGKQVDEGNTFAGKTIIMCMDINLAGTTTDSEGNTINRSFDPIGYGYESDGGQVFKGTFDGNGNTIYNLYQNGWDLGLSYSTAGGGLFASAVDATFKNLTLDNAYVVMECIDMGALVGYAYGTCNFENIIVSNSTIANYNRYTGGVIGEVNGTHTLTNVDVDAGTTIAALWGTFDPSIGGIIGGKYGDATVTMTACDVACKLDVFNDVTSAYQWYSYRRCGMLIGYTEQSKTDENGRTEAVANFLKTENCTVCYGDWVNYHYCEFSHPNNTNNRYPFVRAEAGLFNDSYSNPRYGQPIDAGGNKVVDDNHQHAEGEQCGTLIKFHQLYGGGQGCYGGNDHVDNNKGVRDITENVPAQTAKFVDKGVKAIYIGSEIKLGELFGVKEGTEPQSFYTHVYVTPVNQDVTARATVTRDTADWTQTTIKFNENGVGEVKITINDYYYCEPTTITVAVRDYAYSVTYTDRGEVLYVEKVKDNTVPYSIRHDDLIPERDSDAYKFAGWVNAGGNKVDTIPAGNTTDYVLYDSWSNIYTARFVDQQGNVIYEEEFTSDQEALTYEALNYQEPALPASVGGYSGEWNIKITKNGTTEMTPLSGYDLRNAGGDITVYPLYNAEDGIVKLTPMDPEGDGIINYYAVSGVEENDNNIHIVIPSEVNGISVEEISGGAFAEFDNITTVTIPKSIKKLGADAFANEENKPWYQGGALKYEQITFLYEGTYAQWQAIDKDENWDRYVGQGSRIYFLADGTYSEETARNGTWSEADRVWSDPVAGTYEAATLSLRKVELVENNAEESIVEETVPEETVPEETVPEETVPEETIPEEIAPEESVPEEIAPEEEIDYFDISGNA